MLLLVHPRPQQRRRHASLRESLVLVRRNPRLLWLRFVVLAAGFASDPVNTEAPAFAHVFGHPDTFAGLIIGAFGAGAVGAAIATAGREGSARRTVVTSRCSRPASPRSRWVADALDRLPVPRRRGPRLPHVERASDRAAPARGGRVATWPDHGAVVGGVPRASSRREPRRQRDRRRIRRPPRGRRPRAARARGGGADLPPRAGYAVGSVTTAETSSGARMNRSANTKPTT